MNTSTITGNQSSGTNGEQKRTLAEIAVWSLVLVVIMVISVVGSLLTIVCALTDHKLREDKGNILLVNLSLTDLFNAVTVIPSSLQALVLDRWGLGHAWCNAVCAANYTLIIVSMLTLCFISLDRYAAVVHALHYHSRVTRTRIYLLLAYAWVQGACFGAAPIYAGWVVYDYWEVVCAIEWQRDHKQTLTYVTVAFIVCFLCPGVIMAAAYRQIMKVARTHNSVQPLGVFNGVNQINEGALNKPLFKVARSDVANGQSKMSEYSSSTSKDTGFAKSPGQTTATNTAAANKGGNAKESKRRIFNYVWKLNTHNAFKICTSGETVSPYTAQSAIATIQSAIATTQPAIATIHGSTFSASLKIAGGGDAVEVIDPTIHAGSGASVLQLSVESIEDSPSTSLGSRHISASVVRSTFSAQSNTTSDQAELVKRLRRYESAEQEGWPVADAPGQQRRPKRGYGVSNKAVRSLLIVVIAFFICMTPFCCTKLYKVIVPEKNALPGYTNWIASLCQYCSSAINPLIYGIFRKDYRAAFKSLLKRFMVKL
ncbi:hypothetical protein Btru_049223 [Bulinus truncatus]|nr:hypothetical protein Btru_049223 [Bulinus truncatus]